MSKKIFFSIDIIGIAFCPLIILFPSQAYSLTIERLSTDKKIEEKIEEKIENSRKTIWDDVVVWVQDNLKENGAIYILLTTGITGTCVFATSKLRELIQKDAQNKTLESLRQTIPLSNNERRNSIIIVGLGGTGKTTLINRLLEEDRADAGIATKNYKVYTSTNNNGTSKYSYYVSDYMGQNIGTLISGLMLEQKTPYSPMTLGAISSIIFVVDLIEAPQHGIVQTQNQNLIDWKKRANIHVSEWSRTALDMIFGVITTTSLKYVCLFINKIDLFPDLEEDEVRLEYQKLINEIAVRSRGFKFECLIGSAERGTGVPSLKASLKDNSVNS